MAQSCISSLLDLTQHSKVQVIKLMYDPKASLPVTSPLVPVCELKYVVCTGLNGRSGQPMNQAISNTQLSNGCLKPG